MPEPLNKVLEPMSIHHLDMPDEELEAHTDQSGKYVKPALIRHGSVGAAEDPGVIGPIVWNMHHKKLQHGNYWVLFILYRTLTCKKQSNSDI